MLLKTLKKHNKTIKNWFVYGVILGIFLNIVGTVLMIDRFSQIGAYLCIIAVFMCFAYFVIVEETSLQSILMLGFVCIIMLSLLVTKSVSSKNPETYRHIVNTATFLELPILLFCYGKDERKNVLDVIFAVFMFLAVLYFACSFQSKYYNPRHGNALTLGYFDPIASKGDKVNPNQTAMQAVQCVLILLCAFVYYKDTKVRVFYLVGVLISVYVVFLAKSRTCLVIVLLTIVLFVLQGKVKIKRYFVLIAFLVPIFMAGFILFGESIYENWNFLGETFDYGRKEIFEIVFKDVSFISAFFGNVGYHGFDNNHNAILTVFANFGLIGFSFLFGFIMHKMFRVIDDKRQSYQTTAIIGMLSLIVHSAMESAAFISTISYVTIPFFILYFIASTTNKKALKGFEGRAHNLF